MSFKIVKQQWLSESFCHFDFFVLQVVVMKKTILSRQGRNGEDEAKSGSPPAAAAAVAELAAAAQLSGERQTPLKTKTTSAKGRTSKQSCVCNPQPPVFNLNNIPIYIDAFFAFLDHHFEKRKICIYSSIHCASCGACK